MDTLERECTLNCPLPSPRKTTVSEKNLLHWHMNSFLKEATLNRIYSQTEQISRLDLGSVEKVPIRTKEKKNLNYIIKKHIF